LKRLVAKGLIAMDPLLSRSIRVIKSDLASTPTETRDPADDAAWPLPEGWRWNSRFAYKADDFHTVWVEDGAMRVLGARTVGIPLAVVRTLLARWEAGQA
jgi:hypothetical protein